MRFTATMRGHVGIANQSSAELGMLTPDDYERFLDALNDSLFTQEVEDVTIGGSLIRGDIEVSFSVEADVLASAHQRAIAVINIANTDAVAKVAMQLTGPNQALSPHWTESVSPALGSEPEQGGNWELLLPPFAGCRAGWSHA